MLSFFHHGEMVAHVPAEPLVLGGGAPVYDRAYTQPKYIDNLQDYNSSNITAPTQLKAVLEKVVSSPNLLSKRWIYEQYDSMVRTNTRTTNTASDAAVIRVKENGKGIAATVDCNSTYVYADPYQGAMIAVAEAARNLVCAGAEPLAVTNNLNFGNPYNEEVYWQFVHAVKGMGDACRKFNTPVTGGNVSFYNQSVLKDKIEPIYPTPTIGMIGLINDQNHFTSLSFQHEGDCLFLIGKTSDDLNQSEYIKRVFNINESKCPRFELEEEYHLQQVIKNVIRSTRVRSVHDIAEGGLFMNLLESGFENGKGFEITNPTKLRDDVFLLSESQSRVVVSIAPEFKNSLTDLLAQNDLDFVELGSVTGSEIRIGTDSLGSIEDWKNTYDHKLAQLIEA